MFFELSKIELLQSTAGKVLEAGDDYKEWVAVRSNRINVQCAALASTAVPLLWVIYI